MAEKQNTLILIIAANPSTREGMAETLSGTRFVLHFAESAAEGLQKAEELLPAVIVVDLDPQTLRYGERETNLQDEPFDAYAACRRLRVSRLLNGIPILMLCSRQERDARAAGLSAGADDFLDKPLDGIELLARLSLLTRLSLTGRLLSDLTRFSWMVEHAHEGYLMLDLAGAIHFANERAQNLLNLPEDFIGLPFVNVVERQYTPEPAETWETWLEDPAPCFLVQPEGPTARAVWVVLEALDTPIGAEYHRIARLRDETERMSLYHDMRKFHTIINHKLRTPVSMLYTSMSIIKSQIDDMTLEEIKKMMGSAIRGAERLTEEVRNVLTYLDAPLALNLGTPARLEEMPEMIRAIAARLHLRNVILSLPEELRALPIGLTPDALEMILYELMDNSHKFHPTQAPFMEISVQKLESDLIHIRVADDGLNLSAEQLDWAWVPYFQNEKDFTGEMPGTGLGFPMVATLVWKAGGTLRLRNRSDGPGVIVDLNIPLEAALRKLERSALPYGV